MKVDLTRDEINTISLALGYWMGSHLDKETPEQTAKVGKFCKAIVDKFDAAVNEPPALDRTYSISADGQTITCHVCHRTSGHPDDIKNKYCGYCHTFHEDSNH